MGLFFKKHWPVIAVLILYWGAVLFLLSDLLYLNHGHLVYTLDDPYIQMSIAKNTVQHGVWGITRYAFSNSTSSPLWTALLTLSYFLFGVNEWSPLVLNVIFGTMALFVTYLFVGRTVASRLATFIVLAITLFVTPLPALTFTGMEHVLHACFTLAFLYFFLLALSPGAKNGHSVALLILSACLPATRYEGLFLILISVILLAVKKRKWLAGLTAIAALLPIGLYGLWSLSKGWYFFPNSVLLKGNVPGLNFTDIGNFVFGYDLLSNVQENLVVFVLLLVALFLFLRLNRMAHHPMHLLALTVWIGMTLIHLQLAALGWFYRYEGYLVFTGIAVLGVNLYNLLPKPLSLRFDWENFLPTAAGILLVVLIASPLGFRGYDSIHDTPLAANNIYEQQYQMGLFLKRNYQGATIALNDVGAVNFLADIRLLDLWGLGSLNVASLRLEGHYRTYHIAQLAQEAGASIAIVYDGWYADFGGLPPQWEKVGNWTVRKNIVLGGDTVSFYAIEPSGTADLVRNLQNYRPMLPNDIKQSGRYTQ